MAKDFALYPKIQAFYPFLGTSQAQHKWNAKNPQDTNAAFRLQFFGGGTHSNLGYQCNGTNAYANTFFNPSLNGVATSFGATLVCGTNNNAQSADVTEMGSTNPASATNMFRFTVKSNNTRYTRYFTAWNQYNGSYSYDINESRGVFTGILLSSIVKMFRNSNIIATGTTGGTVPNGNTFIGSSNQGNSPFGYSNQRIQFVAIHEGLTDAEVQTLHTIIDTFETAIGRKTW